VKRAFALSLLLASRHAWGADAGAPPVSAEVPVSSPTCREHLGAAGERPELVERFPERGKSGYVAELEVEVVHGKGESVLPAGFRLRQGDELAVLEKLGFFAPENDGGAPAATTTVDEGDRARTTLRIPWVLLPPRAGRQELELPPVPVAIARASGAVITLCTAPHRITVEDPIANDPDPKPRGNPPPRPQLEEWTALKHAVLGAAAAVVLGALLAWAVRWWMRRPRPSRPAPPPRPPWEVALEELSDLERERLVDRGELSEHFDRVSHAVRRYLGDRYGFDGLECTTSELVAELRRIVPPIVVLEDIETFLARADLVKFAKAVPTEAECHGALEHGRAIVNRTIPPLPVAPPEPEAAPPEATP
jgi:hypothetical protein